MKVLLFVQCFPPLLKYAGGVSKRYFHLCNSLIEESNYDVTIMTPIDITRDPDVSKLIYSKKLEHIPIDGILFNSPDGQVLGVNVFSPKTLYKLCSELRKVDICIIDDIVGRCFLQLLISAFNVKTIVTSHTDATKLQSYNKCSLIKLYFDKIHNFKISSVHATVSKVYGKKLNIHNTWPPLIWSDEFKKTIDSRVIKAERRNLLAIKKGKYDGILLFCGRWSPEKKIENLIKNVPLRFLLVIVGDSDNEEYIEYINILSKEKNNVLFIRKVANAKMLTLYYHVADMYVSASDFETLGNTLIEAWVCKTPVAVQPEQGHLEYLENNLNGFAIDFKSNTASEKINHAFDNRHKLPKLHATSEYFRNVSFNEEFHNNLINLVLALEIHLHTRIINFVGFIILWCIIGIPFEIFVFKINKKLAPVINYVE